MPMPTVWFTKNLEVHHLRLSTSNGLGHDCLENLITLCHACHYEIHGHWPGKHKLQLVSSGKLMTQAQVAELV